MFDSAIGFMNSSAAPSKEIDIATHIIELFPVAVAKYAEKS